MVSRILCLSLSHRSRDCSTWSHSEPTGAVGRLLAWETVPPPDWSRAALSTRRGRGVATSPAGGGGGGSPDPRTCLPPGHGHSDVIRVSAWRHRGSREVPSRPWTFTHTRDKQWALFACFPERQGAMTRVKVRGAGRYLRVRSVKEVMGRPANGNVKSQKRTLFSMDGYSKTVATSIHGPHDMIACAVYLLPLKCHLSFSCKKHAQKQKRQTSSMPLTVSARWAMSEADRPISAPQRGT